MRPQSWGLRLAIALALFLSVVGAGFIKPGVSGPDPFLAETEVFQSIEKLYKGNVKLKVLALTKFPSGSAFEVKKVDKPGFANVWFVVPPNPPDAVMEKVDLQLVRNAILAINERPSLATTTEIQQTMTYLLIRREAVSSSRMEGTWSTVDEVLSPAITDVSRSATASVRGYAKIGRAHV